MKLPILTTLFVLCTCVLFAQKSAKEVYFSTNIGRTASMFDDASGYHIELMPGFKVTNRVDLISQFSFSVLNIKSTFISGRTGRSTSKKLLLGTRFYFSKPSDSFRFYTNILCGIDYYNKQINNDFRNIPLEGNIGYSLGTYGRHRSGINGGLAFESPGIFVLKLGYHF